MNCKIGFQSSNKSGQAMVEFMLGLMVIISFFFFYVRMCAVFAIGNYIHYATFMAARAYMSSAATEDAQKGNADAVLKAMLSGRFKTLIKAKEGDGSSIPGASIGSGPYFDPRDDAWNQGVTFHFTSKLSLVPWSQNGQSILLDLTSESWLPKEEPSDQCIGKKKRISDLLGKSGVVNVSVEWDNGC